LRFVLDLACSIKGVDPLVDDVGCARLRLERPPIDAARQTQELRASRIMAKPLLQIVFLAMVARLADFIRVAMERSG
jgi:hypothetical protein